MPSVHCVSRKWLEERKLKACLQQAERMKTEVSSLAVAISGRPAPQSSKGSPPADHSIDTAPDSNKRCYASSKKRRLLRRCQDSNSNVVTPRYESTMAADHNGVISDTPAQSKRKRKPRSCQGISEAEFATPKATSLTPHDNDL